jgi:hypothetical protein
MSLLEHTFFPLWSTKEKKRSFGWLEDEESSNLHNKYINSGERKEHLESVLNSLTISTVYDSQSIHVCMCMSCLNIRLMSQTRICESRFCCFVRNTHLGRREKWFKEMDYSLGKFVFYSFRHMHIAPEMPMCTIRQLYVQFTMTIISTSPTV